MKENLSPDRLAGSLLLAYAVLGIAAITHHPVVSQRAPAELVKAIVAVGPMDGFVHGFLIVLMALLYFALLRYARRRGLQSGLVLGGLIAASIGLASLTEAALIDGFFGPAFGARLAMGNQAAIGAGIQVMVAAALAIQILSKLGFVATAASIVLWSIDLLDRESAHVMLGALGLVTQGLGLTLLLTVASTLTPHTIVPLFAAQALWYAAAGALMIRGRL